MNYEDRDYQVRAINWLAKRFRGIVQSPAGSGKTIIASSTLSKVILSKPTRMMKVKVGWMAHTIEQCDQARKALDGFPEAMVMMDVKIACAAAETDWSDRDVLIVDECQWAGCGQWMSQIETCNAARWGFSATPFIEGDTTRNDLILNLFGGQIFVIEREAIQDNLAIAIVSVLKDSDPGLQPRIDAAASAAINRRKTYWKGPDWELEAQCRWQACMDIGIVGNNARNNAIVQTALTHSQSHSLILVNKIEHGAMIQARVPGSSLCFSKMSKKLRKKTIEMFRNGEIRCLIATSLADEGLDIPIADVLILACGGRSENKLIQRTGRVLRKVDGKFSALIYDFEDTFHKMANNHFHKRLSVYKKLKYRIPNEYTENIS